MENDWEVTFGVERRTPREWEEQRRDSYSRLVPGIAKTSNRPK